MDNPCNVRAPVAPRRMPNGKRQMPDGSRPLLDGLWSAREEPGSASVAVAGAILALATVAILLLQVIFAAGERMQTQNVADLTAISAAIVYRDTGSQREACARAAELAEGYSVGCAVEGSAVRVTLRRESAFAWITRSHEASALAGPARGP